VVKSRPTVLALHNGLWGEEWGQEQPEFIPDLLYFLYHRLLWVDDLVTVRTLRPAPCPSRGLVLDDDMLTMDVLATVRAVTELGTV